MASAFMIAAGVAAAALAGRAIVRAAQQGRSGGGGMMAHFTKMTSASSERGFEEPMSKGEAAKILGISSGADKEAIAKVHRKLMIFNHPDRGGSPYLATKVNEAKEVLTGTNNRGSVFR
mmetsp:Transcript_41407/g.80915  ORF Transcript_41407/g.80915 Transcript_41407/m.80915 type:complete len:119 (-) Transcript_41407:217-573(-)|eukprot:CAMPEP_0173394466 /NCGR_PEP_ID=MMETSP1356-20130122/27516_1 /TAXON_ID=77927 ORGANISM="Hemiselmis virescens, Strain PCC157" /NCGR_SAMPLE_ID=MMETSP1356 /ASSEMBLY_ACC=CAM_ASM_000847 /LENGTH=118 /DNA_ID=CAMNT_0014352831 /DNA_START=228 /DNA_END=584 /DNA_ORIENTATION=-